MSGFGQAPVFGAQALLADASNSATSSPFQAPSTHASPFALPSQPQPPAAFGAPTAFSSNSSQNPRSSSAFGGLSSATNGLGSTSSVGGLFGGHNTSNKDAMMSNPFATATAATLGPSASNPFATQTQVQTTTATANPFANATAASAAQNGATSTNPFTSAASTSPFASVPKSTDSTAPITFGQPISQSKAPSTPFAPSATNNQKRKNAFEDGASSKRWGPNSATTFQTPQASFAAPLHGMKSTGFGGSDAGKTSNGFADHLKEAKTNVFGSAAAAAPAQSLSAKGQKKSPSTYAAEIYEQLRKDRLRPPQWPKNPGDPSNIKAMDDYRVKYKAYETKVRTSLIKAGLIDDPDVRKKLSDAIDFRGICEEMCPEGEKVSRIVEHDVKFPERIHSAGQDDGWANPDLMIKSFKRSAAGTDSPLPTEVRSPAALRRTLNYLIDDVLRGDENLPALHGFLWDRTRAIRKDFIFQNAMTPAERIDQIYCLENITRFHAVSLHLLSRDGKEDFSEQQEREQLGKTLLSLMQVYDECKDMDIKIESEAEFRAYYLLFNAHDTFVIQQMQDWSKKFWYNSTEIQTAVTLIEAMRNVFTHRGPLRPSAPLTTGSPSFTSYFSIVESPEVSYTMACLAEIHFTEIRRQILKGLHRAYGRVRDGPKDLTAKVLNEQFRFDTEEECVAFLEDLDMEFSSEGASEPYLLVQRRRGIPAKTIKQSFSESMVELKRCDHTLPEVVHSTIFQKGTSAAVEPIVSSDSLFVAQPSDMPIFTDPRPTNLEIKFSNNESSSSSPAPIRQSLAAPPTSSLFNSLKSDTTTRNPFFSQATNTVTDATPVTGMTATSSRTPAFSWSQEPFGVGASINTVPGQSPLQTPQGPLSSTPSIAPPASTTKDTGNIFGFLNKPAEIPTDPSLRTSLAGSSTGSIFPAVPPLSARDEGAGDTSATASSNKTDLSQDTPSLSKPSFFLNTSSAPESTPSFFDSASKPAPLPTASTEIVKSASLSDTSTFTPVEAPEPTPPAPPRDMMGDLAKWVLLGDGGLMDTLQDTLVENLVRETFELYQQEEQERMRQEEDEHSWTEARKFRNWNLRVKFFYRWRELARKKATRRVGRNNREALKAYREAKAAEARAARKKKEREEEARLKRLSGPTSWLDELDQERALKRARRGDMSLDTSRRSSPVSDADALLATGILGGMPNQQQVAENCVRDDDSIYDALVGVHISPYSKRRTMGPPAKPSKDPLRSVHDAGISKPAPKKKWSRKAQQLADLVNGKRDEDDLISFRSSTSSRLGQSLRPVPAAGKVTNFSKYQSSSPRSSVEPDRARNGPSSGIKSSYWLLRSRGLFATPTGHVLSEKAPRPRTGSVHDGASQYSGESEAGDYDDRVLEQDGAYRASLGLTGAPSRRSTFSVGLAGSPPQSGFMKPNNSFRQSLPTGGISKPTSSFRQSLPAGISSPMHLVSPRGDVDGGSQAGSAVSTMQQDVEETLLELRKVAAEMDENTSWYREQNRQMSQSQDLGG